jgi:hypothetical protein
MWLAKYYERQKPSSSAHRSFGSDLFIQTEDQLPSNTQALCCFQIIQVVSYVTEARPLSIAIAILSRIAPIIDTTIYQS